MSKRDGTDDNPSIPSESAAIITTIATDYMNYLSTLIALLYIILHLDLINFYIYKYSNLFAFLKYWAHKFLHL